MEQSEFERARELAGIIKGMLPAGSDVRLSTRKDDPYITINSGFREFDGVMPIEDFLNWWDTPVEELVKDLSVKGIKKLILKKRLHED